MLKDKSYMLQVPTNMVFAIRLLAQDKSEETEQLLVSSYLLPLNIMIKRDIILAMAERNADYWVSNQIKQYETSTQWEKRALLIASFCLGEEGRHWRDKLVDRLDQFSREVINWCGERKGGAQGLVRL